MADLICRPFARMDGSAPFADAICLTQAEWDALSANDLLAMHEARFAAWLYDLANPPVATPGEPDPIVDFGD
jgi:hypothetical protein